MSVLRLDLVDLSYSWKEIEMLNAKKMSGTSEGP